MALQFPIYLDNHSTTPVDPLVLEAMMPYFTNCFGNASSKSHCFGWKAEFAVEKAREQVAKILGADTQEIIFTSGATESNNFTLLGITEKYKNKGKHIITSQVEHKCILEACKYLEKHGYAVTYLPVDEFGQVSVESVRKALRPDTILISIMFANNEVGTINPIAAIGALAHEKGILFHTDAAQAVGKVPINVKEMNIDLLSLSAHKMYGPKGCGALYIRRKDPHVEIDPIMHGGGQERGLRSGTLNVPGIVGLGAACECARVNMPAEEERIRQYREMLFEGLYKELGDIKLNGHQTERLPQSLNLSFPFIESDSLVAGLKSIAVSSTSACMSAASIPSYVLKAMGLCDELMHSSVRFGLGRFTTQEEIEYTIATVSALVKQLREKSPLYKIKQVGQ